MKSFNKLKSDFRKLKKINSSISYSNFSEFINQDVKVTKDYQNWIRVHGEECGIPFNEIQFILKGKPKGKIVGARYDGFEDGFVFDVQFYEMDLVSRLGIEDIKIISKE